MSLAEYVTQIMRDRKLSTRDVQIRSGGAIHASQVSRIASGETTHPRPVKLAALALGLGVPQAEILAVIEGTFTKDNHAERIKILAEELPVNVQEDLLAITEVLHKKYFVRK